MSTEPVDKNCSSSGHWDWEEVNCTLARLMARTTSYYGTFLLAIV